MAEPQQQDPYAAIAQQDPYAGIASGSAPPSEKPGLIQTMKNNFNANTQGAQPGDSAVKGFVKNVGQGGGNFLRNLSHTVEHPIDNAHQEVDSLRSGLSHPAQMGTSALNQAHGEVDSLRADPSRFVGNAVGNIGTGAIMGSTLGKLTNLVPGMSTSRASATLEDIENQAKGVPVPMTKTAPAMQDFRQSVANGGKNASVMNKLGNQINGPEPVNFPDARELYSNLGRATAKPGFLRRAIESPANPAFRYNAGGVREALGSDLTDAAHSIGRGEDYTGAINEYRRGAQLNKALKVGGTIAAGEALRRTGAAGKLFGGIADAAR